MSLEKLVKMEEARVQKNRDVEKKVLLNSPEAKEMRQSFKKTFGFEMDDEKKFPVNDPNFSFAEAKRQLGKRMKEADVTTGFIQLLVAGAQNVVNKAYQAVETSYEKWVTIVPSKKKFEFYTPLQGVNFPNEVPENGKYENVGAVGLSIQLDNKKFGSIYAASLELDEDDQTGQINQMAPLMAEYLKTVYEVYVMGKVASVSGQSYLNLRIPVSETKPSDESNWPFATSAAPFIGGGYNRASSYVALGDTSLKAAFMVLNNQKNLLGVRMAVKAQTLLVGTANEYQAATLANSAYYPVVPGATATVSPGTFSENVLKGLFNPVVSRYMFNNSGSADGLSTAWYLLDASKPFFVLQMREAATLIAEAPNSGLSFEQDQIRIKARQRGNTDFIDPRFMYRGNDGSV